MSDIRRAAIVRNSTNKVLNVEMVDTTSNWQPPEGTTAITIPNDSLVTAGWDYEGDKFVNNMPVEEVAGLPLPNTASLQNQIDELVDMILFGGF